MKTIFTHLCALLLVWLGAGCTGTQYLNKYGSRVSKERAELFAEETRDGTLKFRRVRDIQNSALVSEIWYKPSDSHYDPILRRDYYPNGNLALELVNDIERRLPSRMQKLARPVDLSNPGFQHLHHTYSESGDLTMLQYASNDTVLWQVFYPDGTLRNSSKISSSNNFADIVIKRNKNGS